MRRLTVGRRAERGAVAVIVAAMFGSMALLGCAALTVDVGTVSLERRSCRTAPTRPRCPRSSTAPPPRQCPNVTNPADPKMARLRGLANGNAADGATAVSRIDGASAVCGAGKAELLRPCAPVAGNQLRDCPALASPPAQFVRVYTQTSRPGGGNTLLPSAFAEAVTGSAAGTRHQVCAAYAWGAPATFSIPRRWPSRSATTRP